MGIDLWFETRFFAHRPPILEVKVLNFKCIKLHILPHKNSYFWFIWIRDAILKFSNSSPGLNLKANDIIFGSNNQLSKLLLKAWNTIFDVLLFRLEYKSRDSYSRHIEIPPKSFYSNLVQTKNDVIVT